MRRRDNSRRSPRSSSCGLSESVPLFQMVIRCVLVYRSGARLDIMFVEHLLWGEEREVLHGRYIERVIYDDEVFLWRVLRLDDEGADECDGHFESTCCDYL